MPASAQIRDQIEAALAQRIPSALTPRPQAIRPVTATRIDALDELLGGGLPIGAISEIVGPECSGRTSLALAFLAQITQQGNVCAWVDVSDALHPESAAATGIDLDRMLWVRCGNAPPLPATERKDSHQPVAPPQTARVQFGGNSPHPRSEGYGLPSAIGDLLGARAKYKRNKTIGTPGAPNRPLAIAATREEQVSTDRQPPRRGATVLEQREAYEPRCAEPQHNPRPHKKSFDPLANPLKSGITFTSRPAKPWSRLDQALRVTDLLLQAGGFNAIVLDMASVSPDFASRVPLATWFRYRAAVERAQSSLLLLTQHPCAKSAAGVVLRLDTTAPMDPTATVFSGLYNRAELSRRRFEQEAANVVLIRKPPQRANATEWLSKTPWTRVR